MEKKYDIIIIGTGTAGRTFAGKVERSKLKIAIVDSREYGGTCPLRGCDPKEILTNIAEVTDSNNRLIGKGVGINTPSKLNWTSLIEFKKTFTENYSSKIEKHLVEMGIDTYHGRAHFENKTQLLLERTNLKESIFSWLQVQNPENSIFQVRSILPQARG